MSLGTQFGVLSTGFSQKQITDLTSQLNGAMQAAFGASIDVSPQSRFGQIIGVMAGLYLELWNLASAIYASFDPNLAIGSSLRDLGALTGTNPALPTASTATETATGTPGTVIPTTAQVSVTGTGSVFQNSGPAATIAAQTAWAQSTPTLLAARVTANGKVWQCTAPGTTSNTGAGPTGSQGASVGDGTVTWLCLGSGTGAVDFPVASTTLGRIVAAAGSMVTIVTPVAGWSSAWNISAAAPGQATETDSAFRARRASSLQAPGKTTLGSILAAALNPLNIPGMTAANVFENVGDTTDSDGRPPHSVEVMISGVVNALQVATVIFQNVAAGIATYGNQSAVLVPDSQGQNHSILWSQPVATSIWVTVNAVVNPAVFPANGAQLIINNILAYGLTMVPGQDVVASQLAAAIIAGVPSQGALPVPGLFDPGLPLIGLSNPPTVSTTIDLGTRQQASFSQGNILVNVSNGTF